MTRSAARIAAGFLALLGLGSAAPLQAKTVSPEQAPAEWVAYAEAATATITGWLNGDEAPAPKVRAAMAAARPAPDQPPAPLVVKVWVGRDGKLSKVEFASLGAPSADQDLRDLLVGRTLPPPPKRMRQPMRVALQLNPRPPAAGDTANRRGETIAPGLREVAAPAADAG